MGLGEGRQQKMEAERQMDSGSGEKAQKSAEEARRYLEQAKQDLARERRRYEELRQEELIFRLVEDLKEFQKEQERIRDAVKALDETAAGRTLTRLERRALKTLSGDESRLRGRVDERVKALEKEGSPAFERPSRARASTWPRSPACSRTRSGTASCRASATR
jgi:hypothetical protein